MVGREICFGWGYTKENTDQKDEEFGNIDVFKEVVSKDRFKVRSVGVLVSGEKQRANERRTEAGFFF
jgi:hypothetical protein